MTNALPNIDAEIVGLEDEVRMCADGGNVGGFYCRFVLGIIFPEQQ